MKIKEIRINEITTNPLQPREYFDKESIQELANSIKEADLLQPIVVRKAGKTYQIIAGERRWRAFNILKKKTIPTIVWSVKDDMDALEKSAIENLQREDLTSTERENVITELWNSGRYKRQEDLAKNLGIDEVTISRLTRAKKDREEFSFGPKVSTTVIEETTGLEPNERLEVIKRVEKGTLGSRGVREEVRLIKAVKEIKEKYKIEIPTEMKKAKFTINFAKECSRSANYFDYCNKAPKEVWEKAFTESQLKTMRNNATALFNELSKFLEMMEWL